MNQTLLAFVIGLLGGVLGALAATQLAPGEGGSVVADDGTDLSDVVMRLERIEDALGRPGLRDAPGLSGSGERPASSGAGVRTDPHIEAIVARLEERLKPTLKETVASSVNEALDARGGEVYAEAEREKKKVTLAEAAAEIGLSAEEEEAVRRIANESANEFLKLLAGKDGNVDDVRREFEEARDDPKKRGQLTAKYMGTMMSNLGGVMGVVMSHRTKMNEALGAEKAGKLEDEYDVTDLDPLGLEATFDFD